MLHLKGSSDKLRHQHHGRNSDLVADAGFPVARLLSMDFTYVESILKSLFCYLRKFGSN